MKKIESLQNRKVKEWTALHKKKDRDESGLFLVEGEHLIQEALHAGAVETIITDQVCPFDFEDTVEVTPQIMQKISANVSAVHLIAVCKRQINTIENLHRIILLDGVQDPGNLGTLIRTAVSFSFDAVYLSNDTCDLYNEKTIRSTQGAMFHIPVIRGNLEDFIQELKKEDVQIIATALNDSKPMQEISVSSKMAFIFGNEGQGVSQRIQDLSDEKLRIEMHGFESLNVAVAGGIVMYQYRNI